MERKQQSCSLEDTKEDTHIGRLNVGNGEDVGVYNKPRLKARGKFEIQTSFLSKCLFLPPFTM